MDRRTLTPQLIGGRSCLVRKVSSGLGILGREILLADELSHRWHRRAAPAPAKERKP